MDYSFGTWVRRRRKALDLTQQELAQRVGCSPSLVFKIESDGRRPSRQIAELLAEQLEIPPAQRELFMKVARQEKSVGHLEPIHPVSKAKPVSISHQHSPSDLPLPLTSIIGREHELHAIIQKIQEPSCRLFTLIGPGGVGKTRLAMEVAHRLRDTFESGVCFVSLDGTSSTEFIIPAIADALGFIFSGTLELKAQLFHFLKEKQTLIILDNLEHLLNGIELLDDLLQYAPKVKVLATSREQLNLRAEWVFEVQGLPVHSNLELGKLGSNSAAALFIERARQVSANFSPSPEDLTLITRICHLVDGLPLGLELAASWVRLISLQEIAGEIERSIDFLTTTVRDVPQRHRSLRAVFDHSWNLLSQEERQAMQRISIFRGGFTREAAEQVAGASLPLLSSLVEKSLVRRSAAKRYDLHDLIGQYAATFLAQNTQIKNNTLTAFSEYYLNLFHLRDSNLKSSLQKDTLMELAQEIDNLRLAWELAVTHGMVTLLGKAASPLWYFYNLRDALREGEIAFLKAANAVRARLDRLELGADMTERTQLDEILCELLSHQAQFTFRQGRNLEAAGLYQSSLALLRPQKESDALAQALTYCGVVCWIAGEFDKAWNFLNEGFLVSSKIGDEWLQAQCHTFMGVVAHAQGDFMAAYNYLSDSMLHARMLGDARLISFVAGQLGPTTQALGRTSELMDLLRESLELAKETGDRLGIGVTFEQMAVVTQASGDGQEARRLLEESIKQFRDIGDAWFLAHALNLDGNFALAEGKYTQAQASFKEACGIALANQAPPNILDSLTGLAMLDGKNGRHEQALETALFVHSHAASTWETKERAEKLCSELENKLAPAQIEAVRSRVQLINLDAKVREITCQ